MPNLALYETAKAGIEGLSRARARDLGSDGIRVNAVLPGSVVTQRQERWFTPEDIEAILRNQCLKARDDARMCTGHAYFIDAGWL